MGQWQRGGGEGAATLDPDARFLKLLDEENYSSFPRIVFGDRRFFSISKSFLRDCQLARSSQQRTLDSVFYLDDPATPVSCLPGWTKQIEVLEATRMGLLDRIHRTVAGGVL